MSEVQVRVMLRKSHHRGERGEKGQSANSKIKHTEPLTSELSSTLYVYSLLKADD